MIDLDDPEIKREYDAIRHALGEAAHGKSALIVAAAASVLACDSLDTVAETANDPDVLVSGATNLISLSQQLLVNALEMKGAKVTTRRAEKGAVQ